MPQEIDFEGTRHVFPDDFTQQDISRALSMAHPLPASIPGMERLGGTPPAAGQAPKPAGLTDQPMQDFGMSGRNPRTGQKMRSGSGPLAITDQPLEGAGRIAEGVEQLADVNAPGTTAGRQLAGGASKIIRGGMQIASPALPAAAIAAPAAVATGLGVGSAVGTGTEATLKASGVSPEYAELAGDVAGLGTGALAATKALGAAEAVKNRILPPREPHDLMIRALKPKSTNLQFGDSLNRSMPDVKAVEPQIGPITNTEQLLDAIPLAKKANRAQYNQMLGPNAKSNVDGGPIADAVIGTIPDQLKLENPTAARAIAKQAMVYKRPFTVEQLDDFLQTTNAQLEAYYNKYPISQRKALAGNPRVAALEAKARAIRDVLYNALDDPGQGAAARELQRRYGALLNLEGEAHRRLNVALRQAPNSLSEQISNWSAAGMTARGIFRLLHGDVSGAADVGQALTQRSVAKWLKEQNTTDAMIRDAFKSYTKTPEPIQMPPPFRPAGLLTQGDIITPPPADTSSVRAIPADIGQQVTAMRKALPAPQPGQPPLNVQPRGPGSVQLPPYMPESAARPLPMEANSVPTWRPRVPQPPAPIEPPPQLPTQNLTNPVDWETTGWPRYKPPGLAKGGIVTQPTVAEVGEEGPEAIVPLSGKLNTVPESKDTLREQLMQLAQGDRKAVMFPHGTDLLKRPKGMQSYMDADGNTFIYNPDLTSSREIESAVAQNRLPALLGHAQEGMGAPDKTELTSAPVAVVGRTLEGTPTQDTVTDQQHLPQTVSVTQKLTPPNGTVSVEPPEKVLAERRKNSPKGKELSRGMSEIPMDEKGIQEGIKIGDHFARDGGLDKIYHGPLGRTKQMAALIANQIGKDIPTQEVRGLRTWSQGGFEGQPSEDHHALMEDLMKRRPDVAPPGKSPMSNYPGEPYAAYTKEALSSLQPIIHELDRNPGEKIGVVTHSQFIRAVRAWLAAGGNPNLQVNPDALDEDPPSPGEVERLYRDYRGNLKLETAKNLNRPGAYLIRHGETVFNAPPKQTKDLDVPDSADAMQAIPQPRTRDLAMPGALG